MIPFGYLIAGTYKHYRELKEGVGQKAHDDKVLDIMIQHLQGEMASIKSFIRNEIFKRTGSRDIDLTENVTDRYVQACLDVLQEIDKMYHTREERVT